MRYVNTFATLGLTVALTLAFPQATSTTDDSTAITDAAAATDAALVPESGLSVSADEADAQGRGTAHVNNNCPFDVYGTAYDSFFEQEIGAKKCLLTFHLPVI